MVQTKREKEGGKNVKQQLQHKKGGERRKRGAACHGDTPTHHQNKQSIRHVSTKGTLRSTFLLEVLPTEKSEHRHLLPAVPFL
jgi:hypothetical protein